MRLEEIYSKIPAISCKRKCQLACGPIPMAKCEFRIIYGREPNLKEMMTEKHPLMVNPVDASCPKLGRDGDCRIYENRPLICRLFGVVRRMACPHGCEPERWLSDKEAHALLDATDRL